VTDARSKNDKPQKKFLTVALERPINVALC
jgi:hypothetical protein